MNHPFSALNSQSAIRRSLLRMCLALQAAAVLVLLPAMPASAQRERPAMVTSQQGSPSPAASATSANIAGNIGGLTDEPIGPGQVVHVLVFNAPDFSEITRVSEKGDIAFPVLGSLHIEGLNSRTASQLIETELKQKQLMNDPHATVTVEGFSTGVTILGEVRAPGIYPMLGKHLLSDIIATAGGLTANTGRVIEISSNKDPGDKHEVAWDPTMHNTSSYDYPIHPGDRILVRSCGIAYIGGHVAKPGAYSLCGSQQITLSELVALAGGSTPLTSDKHVYLIRKQPDGTRAAEQVNLHHVLRAKLADPEIHEDDIVYVTPSTVKDILNRAVTFSLTSANTLFYSYRP